MNKLSILNPFHKPPAKVMAQQTLEDYERRLLESEAAASYHAKMVEYYRESIDRLKQYPN